MSSYFSDGQKTLYKRAHQRPALVGRKKTGTIEKSLILKLLFSLFSLSLVSQAGLLLQNPVARTSATEKYATHVPDLGVLPPELAPNFSYQN